MYTFKYLRYDSCKSFDEAYEQWVKDRSDSTIEWEDSERTYWKTIFFAKTYGVGPERLRKIIAEAGKK